MQVIRREEPAVPVQIKHGRRIRLLQREHIDHLRQLIAFGEIAGRARRHNILPRRLPAFGARDHMVKGQLIPLAAILARESIPQKHVEPCKRRMTRRRNIGFQRNNRWQPDFSARATDGLVIKRDNINPIQHHGFDRILPVP